MSLQDGISIPVVAGTTPSYNVRTKQAFEPYGYQNPDPTSSRVYGIAASQGNQTWDGKVMKFNGTGTCSGFDTEGYVKDGEVIVTNIVTDTLAGVGVSRYVIADDVHNAVWNDIADCIEVPETTELEYGYAYCTDGVNYYKSSKYLDEGFVGIHSDTAGFFMGDKGVDNQLKTAVAGFVLAYVDKDYRPGTPLTCGEGGVLTELKEEDIELNPHKLVGTFWKDEPNYYWGFDDAKTENLLVKVNGRKWVKVR